MSVRGFLVLEAVVGLMIGGSSTANQEPPSPPAVCMIARHITKVALPHGLMLLEVGLQPVSDTVFVPNHPDVLVCTRFEETDGLPKNP